MSMFGNIAVQGELELLLEEIENQRELGQSDTVILKNLEVKMKSIIEECRSGWR